MANLDDSGDQFPDIYQFEQTDPLLSGAPNEATGAGMDNIPHLQLARRTRWLKTRVDTLLAAVVNATTNVAGIVRLNNTLTSDSVTQAATANTVRLANNNANGRVPQARTITGAGLATGGGALDQNRIITVPKASAQQAIDGEADDVALTPATGRAQIEALLASGNDSAPALVPTGAIMDFAMPNAPQGWLVCDGAQVSRTEHAALFAAIGTTWGAGNGSSTFNLPDFRGEFRRGWDKDRGVDPGRDFATTQADEFKLHGHPWRQDPVGPRSSHVTGTQGGIPLMNEVPRLTQPAWSGEPSDNAARQIGGSGGAETRPRNIAVLTCIKA